MPKLPADVVQRYHEFKASELEQFHVWLRRRRADELRLLLSRPAEVTLDVFNREVWRVETAANLRGERLPIGALFEGPLSTERIADIRAAAAAGELELHGNFLWGSGARIFGAQLPEGDHEKLALVHGALEILNGDDSPLRKAERIGDIRGFGDNISTGLVMVFHPMELQISNQVSKAVVQELGYESKPLEAFEESVARIRSELGADDFIELDWFMYLRHQQAPRPTLSDLTSPPAVEQALDEFDRVGRESFLEKYGFGKARRYFVRRNGSYYDSKAIVGAAFGHQYPEKGPMVSAAFSGGEHGAKAKLEELGFEVVPRPGLAAADTLPLREALEAALLAQRDRSFGEWSDDLQKAVAVTLPNAIRAVVGQDVRVKGSAGFGNQAEIPWVSVMPPGLTGASEGRYVVYLFAADGTKVFLSLSQAVSGQPKRILPELAEALRRDAGLQPDLIEHIDLSGSGELGERYALATAYALEYDAASLPSAGELEADLGRFLSILDTVLDDDADGERPAWIFQANPKVYEIDRALREREQIEWTVRQHHKQVHQGDRVYLWRSGPQGGVVAIGHVGTEPTETEPDPAEDPYYLKREEFAKAEPRVKIVIDHVLDQPLLRTVLLEDPVLRNLGILRFANATVHAVKSEEDQRLRHLLDAVAPEFESYNEPSFAAIVEAIEDVGLTIDEQTLRRYHVSLKTRGFVVLSGISGTGKTWLAEAYAHATGARHLVVPVAPNWTTNEDLLGYLNPLDDTYHDTEFSVFLRSAASEAERARAASQEPVPYHLILDEMNLARVEYYFAKFLSAMELRARSDDAHIELAPGYDVHLPPSLKFVGTVNVDETTHGFADKVYDRSQLIELTIDRESVLSHLEGLPYALTVADVWTIVRDVAPFAFRVLDEIQAYVTEAAELGVDWEVALDEELLQKVLPKIKGTDLRLAGALREFVELAVDRFPLSHAKAYDMLTSFTEHGFTSYF